MAEPDLQRIETIFQAAADLPAADRTAFLDAECGDDAALRVRVEDLLDSFEQGDSLAPAMAAAFGEAGATTLGAAEGPGAVIDRYKLLQVIGEGGFGVVYMAEQLEPVSRKVALKIIKLGMDTREVVARFEAERQALAMMDHPSIARVLDGGATASGRPYFVMELVRGVAITEYCDRNDLPADARLELFIQVCHAVQHAHQKGVIHRDLKPSNVLVTLHDGRPMPKVIDFGVAKAMHSRLTEKTLFTRYEQFIGTPAYMSPEQAEMSALDVDTRTDIYALGVLLYELLTGTTPFDTTTLRRAGLAEIQRIIREEQPPRPSMRISTSGDAAIARRRGLDVSGLSRALRGDLDWIVMRALEKERGRRYASASEFAEDIRRHLRREPVLAGPPGAAYRVRKLLARHRAAVFTVLVIALVLLGGIVATTAAMLEADRNATLAEQREIEAGSALDFLESMLAMTDVSVALEPDLTVRTLLDRSAARVGSDFPNQPLTEARLRSTIGRAYLSMGEVELAEAQLRRAVELIDAQGGFDASGDVAGEHYTLLWALTNACFNLERGDAFAVSERAHMAAIRFIEATAPQASAALHRFLMAVQADAWSTESGAMADVSTLFDRAVEAVERDVPGGSACWPAIADRFLSAGYMLWYTPHEPLAERFWGQALIIQQRELPPDHPALATTINLLVGIYNSTGRLAEAETLIVESIAALRRLHGERAFAVAYAESTLGTNLTLQGRFAEAEPVLLDAHRVILDTVGGDETNWIVTGVMTSLVNLYDAWERPAEASPYRELVARSTAIGSHTLVWQQAQVIFEPEAAPLVERLEGIRAACGGVRFLVAPGAARPTDLLPLLDGLDAWLGDRMPAEDPRSATTARFLVGWANALDPEHNAEAQRAMASLALPVLDVWRDELPLPRGEALALLSEIAAREGRTTDARQLAEQAWRSIFGAELPDNWFIAAGEIRVARAMLGAGMLREAEPILLRGHGLLSVQLGGEYSDTLETSRLLHDLYTAWGRPDDARRYAVDDAATGIPSPGSLQP